MTTAWRFQEVDPGRDPDSLPSSTCGVVLLTGCGLVGLWSPREGLTRLASPGGGGKIPLPRVEVEGVTWPVAARGSGSGAMRVLEGEGGVRILEEVVLRDGVPGLLLRWSIPETAAGTGRESGGGGAEEGVVHLLLHRGEGTGVERIALTPSNPVARLFHPDTGPAPGRGSFRVQARRRSSRGSLDPDPLTVTAVGPAVPHDLGERVAAAVRALDDASLQEDAEGGALPPFILGMEDGAPVMAGGTPLVEMGLGALASGRFSLAGAILRTLLGDGSAPPLPLVVLAAEWGGRTGETGLLLEGRSALRAAMVQLRSGGSSPLGEPPPHGRSFPAAPSALEALASAVEPLGDRGWTEELKSAASAIRSGAGGARTVLPVLGSSTPGAPEGGAVLLPPVEGFGHPDDPGLLSRRMLHSARLLRAVSHGLLGVHPDVSWGRIRLAPRLPEGWNHLCAAGIRVGDTSLQVEVVVAPGGVEFELTPAAGRIPLNLVFEPDLPLGGVGRVLLSGEVVEVDVLPGPPGRTGIRFQFPLDERKVVRVDPA